MANAPFVTLKGYAIPFLQVERCTGAGRNEYVEHGAFDGMLAGPHSLFLNFGGHDAPSFCRGVTLHTDDYGLGFIASVPVDAWNCIRWGVTRGSAQYASVNLISETVDWVRLADGTPSARIVQAAIDHISITCSPVYAGTGVWPADVVGDMPPRLARLSAKFEQGRRAWLDQKKEAAKVVEARRICAANSRTIARWEAFRAHNALLARARR